jgi:hypothetical protein
MDSSCKAALVAALVVFTAVIHSEAHGALSAQEPVTCMLDESVLTDLPAGAHVELLLAAGNTVPDNRRSLYASMALAVFACAGSGSHIDLLPITDSGVGIAPVFTAKAPIVDSHSVPLQVEKERRMFLEGADLAIKGVLNAKSPYNQSDPLGTLYAAGEALHRAQGNEKRVAIVIGNGWQQTKRINVFAYHSNPANRADNVIEELRAQHALPNLAGTDVIFSGFAPGSPQIGMTHIEMVGLCDFWKKIVHASHGSTPLPCEQALPGISNPLQIAASQ